MVSALSTACSQYRLLAGIEIPGRRPDEPKPRSGSSESCFGRARRRVSYARAESDIAPRGSVRRPCAETSISNSIRCGRQRLRQFERELEASDRIAMRKIAGGVSAASIKRDCLVIFSATLKCKQVLLPILVC